MSIFGKEQPFDQDAPEPFDLVHLGMAWAAVTVEGFEASDVETGLWAVLMDDELGLPVEVVEMYDPELVDN